MHTKESCQQRERERKKKKRIWTKQGIQRTSKKAASNLTFFHLQLLIRQHENKERMFNNQEMFWRRKMWTKWRPQCRVRSKATCDCQSLDTIVCRVRSKGTIVCRVKSKAAIVYRVQSKATFDCQSLDTIFLCSSTPDVPSVVSPEIAVRSSNPISIRIRSDNKITCTGSSWGIVV